MSGLNRQAYMAAIMAHALCAEENAFSELRPKFKESKQLSADDLKHEYDLIMAKKSNLSANKRRAIVRQYERLTQQRG